MTYEHFPTLLLYSSLAWLALLYCFLHMTRAYVSLRHGASKLITARGGLAALERGNPHVRLTRWADWDDRVQRALGRRDGRAFKVVFMLSLVHLALTQALWFFLAYKEAYRPLLKTAFGAPSDNALSGDEAVAAWHGTVMPFTLVRWVLVWILELFVWSHLFPRWILLKEMGPTYDSSLLLHTQVKADTLERVRRLSTAWAHTALGAERASTLAGGDDSSGSPALPSKGSGSNVGRQSVAKRRASIGHANDHGGSPGVAGVAMSKAAAAAVRRRSIAGGRGSVADAHEHHSEEDAHRRDHAPGSAIATAVRASVSLLRSARVSRRESSLEKSKREKSLRSTRRQQSASPETVGGSTSASVDESSSSVGAGEGSLMPIAKEHSIAEEMSSEIYGSEEASMVERSMLSTIPGSSNRDSISSVEMSVRHAEADAEVSRREHRAMVVDAAVDSPFGQRAGNDSERSEGPPDGARPPSLQKGPSSRFVDEMVTEVAEGGDAAPAATALRGSIDEGDGDDGVSGRDRAASASCRSAQSEGGGRRPRLISGEIPEGVAGEALRGMRLEHAGVIAELGQLELQEAYLVERRERLTAREHQLRLHVIEAKQKMHTQLLGRQNSRRHTLLQNTPSSAALLKRLGGTFRKKNATIAPVVDHGPQMPAIADSVRQADE